MMEIAKIRRAALDTVNHHNEGRGWFRTLHHMVDLIPDAHVRHVCFNRSAWIHEHFDESDRALAIVETLIGDLDALPKQNKEHTTATPAKYGTPRHNRL